MSGKGAYRPDDGPLSTGTAPPSPTSGPEDYRTVGTTANATVHYDADGVTLHHGDCLDILRTLPDHSVDAIVTDPPYGLGFMGKEWDELPPGEEWARECLRVLKPGGHLLAFGGTRTWHRLACAVEDAGFEVRDSIAWLYGSGFPKSLDVSKAIDKAAGAERGRVPHIGGIAPGSGNYGGGGTVNVGTRPDETPLTPDAAHWQGWGTALKPAFEPVVVARKPLTGTVAANVLAHGTGALNVDACRIGEADGFGGGRKASSGFVDGYEADGFVASDKGRWPANVVLDPSQAAELDRQSGVSTSTGGAGAKSGQLGYHGGGNGNVGSSAGGLGDKGGASRFFYVAKAPKRERPNVDGTAHPTVKPLALMRWLIRLVTPPGGVILEPFAGSGTTAEACVIEGFRCIAIEREATYLPLILARLSKPIQPDPFGGAA